VLLAGTEQPHAALRMLHDGAGRVVLLAHGDIAPDPALAALVDVVPFPAGEGLGGALAALGASGIVSLLVEAGPRLFAALYDETLIDELVLVHGGGVAGAGAPPLYAGTPAAAGKDLVAPLCAVEAGCVGRDAVTVWRPRAEGTCPPGTDGS